MRTYLLFIFLISFNIFATESELTLEKWDNLSKYQQANLIGYKKYYDKSTTVYFSNLKHIEYRSDQAGINAYSFIENPEHKAMGEKLWQIIEENVFMENEDSFYIEDANIILVGGPYQQYFTIAYITVAGKDHILGMYSRAFEIGCEMPSPPNIHFVKTEAEAEALGCEFSDISWTADVYTDPAFNFTKWDDFMEWTGW